MKLAFAGLQHGLFRRAGIDPRGYRRSGRVAAAFSHRSNAAELHSTRKDAESNTVRRRVIVEMPQIRDAIELTAIEQDLFSDLLDAARKAGLQTTLRAAGGWVRDKLMGRDSLDIDIALDNMLGRDFAERVNEYLRSHGQATHKVGIIMSNPDQSKHLETARMKVRGIWIDLVNLRSEEYAKHSRIPMMEFGTAEQDALRRDFTINALFYNLNEGTVEDFSGRGLQDLRSGLIRTPLPPKETFLDDPLRVLRAVRFASRFGFELEAGLLDAASDDEVREALGHKVSRERIGTELEGMLKGTDPVMAVRMLQRLRLFEAVFEVHPSASADVTEEFAAAGTALMAAAHDAVTLWSPGAAHSEEERRQFLLGALLLPLRACQVKNHKNRMQSMSAHVVRDSLKWRNKDAEAVDALHAVAPRLLSVHRQLREASGHEKAPEAVRVALGRCIRDLKTLWRPGVALASLLPAPEAKPLGVDAAEAEAEAAQDRAIGAPELRGPASDEGGEAEVLEARVEMCRALEAAAMAWGLTECWNWKPVLDGKAVMEAMGSSSGGPWLGKAMDRVVDWSLLHPKGTAEECKAWLMQHAAEFMTNGEQQSVAVE